MKYILFLSFLFNNSDVLNKSNKITEKKEVSILKRGAFEKTGYFFKKTGLSIGIILAVITMNKGDYLKKTIWESDNLILVLLFIFLIISEWPSLLEYIRGKDFKGPND